MNTTPKKKNEHPWQTLYETSWLLIRAYILEKQRNAPSKNTKALLLKGRCYN
ncbi:hypothetical protein U27_02256 [Candidatus Vecturithrix granuli]|uniref:Uncharacterized protein n=1 Tax=Vecturithrix granuli TaxID=1499967 RepID=A0A0S6WA71_VECG1|nr:hypothetical protein U27_02256 [Candidatus Vecturithrix granuli]